jgi:putative mRNA 3-end processing factor
MLEPTPAGLWCPRGGFHVDPVAPVPLAITTHAHADHALPGAGRYVCTPETAPLLRRRLPDALHVEVLPCGEVRAVGDTRVSLHPAGHVLGSAQVRIEDDTGVTVVSGDYKRQADPTCAPFALVPCDTFVTEATFALPIYRWPPPEGEFAAMRQWIAANQADGRPSVLLAYALGKAQRVIASLAPWLEAPVLVHGAVAAMHAAYGDAGIVLPPVEYVEERIRGARTAGRVIVAPPSALGTPWMKRFPRASTAMVSGWMRVRGRRRWRGVDRGFVISDHADWPALLDTVAATGARRIQTTHGYADVLARHLGELGFEASPLNLPSREPEA